MEFNPWIRRRMNYTTSKLERNDGKKERIALVMGNFELTTDRISAVSGAGGIPQVAARTSDLSTGGNLFKADEVTHRVRDFDVGSGM